MLARHGRDGGVSDCRCDRRADRPRQDLAERGGQRGPGWDAGLRGELPGCVAPCPALLAGDQQESSRRDEVLDRAALAVLVIDQGVRQRDPGRVEGWYTRISSADAGAALPSGTTAADWQL